MAAAGLDTGAMRGPPATGGYRPSLRDLPIGSSFGLSAGDGDRPKVKKSGPSPHATSSDH